MRKLISLLLIAAFGFVVLTSATPKKKKSKMFKGTVTYSLNYEGDALTPLQISKLPKTVSIKMFGTMTSIEIVNGPAIITMIERPDDKVKITLIEVMDKKAGMTEKDTTSSDGVDSTSQFTTEIEYSEDTKVIAGYKCKKAVVTFTPKDSVDAEEQTLILFYSPEMGSAALNEDGPYKGIPGLLMEFYKVEVGLNTKFVATEVKKGGVKELDFFFQSDYKEFKSGEELMKYLQGQ